MDLVMNWLRSEFTSDALKQFTFRTSSHSLAEKKNQEFAARPFRCVWINCTRTHRAQHVCLCSLPFPPHQVKHIPRGENTMNAHKIVETVKQLTITA